MSMQIVQVFYFSFLLLFHSQILSFSLSFSFQRATLAVFLASSSCLNAMTSRPTYPSRRQHGPRHPMTLGGNEVYNIIPLHDILADHPSIRFLEVTAVTVALKTVVSELRKPPSVEWLPHMDLLDWLALFFGFQKDNVRNQREHLVLHLANAHTRLSPPPDNINTLKACVLRRFRKRLLKNYTTWCSYLGKKSNIWISDSSEADQRRELVYVSLFLLIWGESANLRFAPECICYIFHHMAMELNKILEDNIDENTGQPVLPSISGENAFLNRVVKPIYETIKVEVECCENGTAPHKAWRNYDDINEYFWSKRCFEKLKWPIDVQSEFFVTSRKGKHVGKTGFVEQRSFWNLFRSFDRLWIMLVLFLQAAVIIALTERTPLAALEDMQIQVEMLSVFFTWSCLRFLQSLLDIVMQYSLVSRDTLGIGVRMAMKSIVAAVWIILFGVLYWRIWDQRNQDRTWSQAAKIRVVTFVEVALLFIFPELLAIVLFLFPCVGNFIEQKNWKVFYVLSWWFQSQSFVGRKLREGLVDNFKYTIFWVLVLSSKFSFSYFLQIKPLIAPTKAILHLDDVHYEWHQFFRGSNKFAAVLVWIPVVLIYLMDLQIWYAIFSSLTGIAVGALDHLGVIRNIEQLKLRFQFFAGAIQSYLMPEKQLLTISQSVIQRLKLRYGFGKPYKKLESNQIEATKFAIIWNEIITIFREEDIISDHEVELLELPRNSWNVRVVRWPCFLLCNELLLALSQATELADAPDGWLWYKICKNEYRRCAVIEAYDCIKHLLLEILKQNSEEKSIVTVLFQEIDTYIRIEKFTREFNMSALPKLHAKMSKFVGILNQPEKDLNQVVNTLQTLYEICIRDFIKEKRSDVQLRDDGLPPLVPASTSGLLFENAVELPDSRNENFYRQIRRLQMILTSRDTFNNIPMNAEARRRIAFFSNSLFMNIPPAPQVEKMMAFSVLTPYHNEEVLYSREQLSAVSEDGISIIYYLQTVYVDEWKNFMERMRREGMVRDDEIFTTKQRDLRLWASYRGQTLSRTVRGMMYYYRALNMLAYLDSASEADIAEASRELGSMRQSTTLDPEMSRSSASLFKGYGYAAASMKFTYVVACQNYGTQKEKEDPSADEILYLMENNEALRVAYVDEVSTGRDETDFYSVLVKYDHDLEQEVEIYRVKLPGPWKLGEGKPENQNHAIIFTRGDALQTIDMNQDNYFEEALKIRNLLEEFRCYYGTRKPTILGVREYIFTGSVSSLASFMSTQETGFVTLTQRVLANPLKIRMHYGHPDVFDRFWFLTRGGISKASRVININEDIFAGFNCTLRGGNVTHHEYIQVGKGRDVGLNQISMFEAKVASGNGEQALSRDVYRLGQRLDFFRMLSFFCSSVGLFFNTMLVILAVYSFLWARLYFALSGIEETLAAHINNKALAAILNQQFIVQLGLFSALPMIVESSLENSLYQLSWDILSMQLQLSSVFFAFSLGTRAHYFGRTILHGGAKYRGTGRRFGVGRKSFAENYRLYARSHFVKAIELGLILAIYASYRPVSAVNFVYIAMTITGWYLVVSWIIAPFTFNPSGFDWVRTRRDFDDFMNWIWCRGSLFAKAEQSWERWWYEEQHHLRTTGLCGKVLEIILDIRFFLFQYGIVYQLGISAGSKSIAVYLLSWVYVVVALGVFGGVACARDKYAAREHIYYRLVQLLLIIIVILVVIALLEFTEFKFMDIFTSLLAFIPTGWGLISIAQVFGRALYRTVWWEAVISAARLYEFMFGTIVMAPVALLSWLPGFQLMQNRVMFNEPFSRGLQASQIIIGKKTMVFS